jgi:hypothetical protein
MSDEQGAISERQREILLATWNLQRGDERTGRPDARSRTQLEDSAKMLADLQATLAQQARTLAQRTRARTFVDQDERVRTFVESLERAAGVMEPAARSLREFRLREAVPAEQQALQQLLRAEAAFRDVQVSMQQNDSGGGGMQASRNFAEMFELEMDLEKNQYESESQLSKQREQQDLDEAIRKLKELAERQEQLAQERRLAGAAQEQRWKQEQLRREAEDLRRRLAELSRERASGQQGQAQNESGSPQEQQAQRQAGAEQEQGSEGGATGNPARDGASAARRSNPRLARALESVDQALRDMQSASDPSRPSESSSNEVPRPASAGSSEQAQQSARNASRSLREALQQMDRREPSNLDERLGEFADRTRQLAEDQRGIENELHEALAESGSRSGPQRFGSRGVLPPERSQPLLESKEQMAGQLSDLQRDMRAAIHAHRTQAPRSTQRLSEIVRDVEGSDLMYRLNRSAAEIYYGRARDAAAREGLITEALEGLEQALREAAVQAAQEQNAAPENATPEALLSQISELRRALAQAAEDTGQRARGDAQARTDTPQAPDAPGRSAGDRSPGERDGSDRNAPARAGDRSAGGAEQRGAALSAWDPIAPAGPLPRETIADESLARQTAAIGRRVRDLAYRLDRGQLSEAELQALRRTANELRRLSGDPMAGRTDALLALIDQVELAALQASLRGREGAPPRASLPAPEAPRYRDSIAEYYRRLGDR